MHLSKSVLVITVFFLDCFLFMLCTYYIILESFYFEIRDLQNIRLF